MSRSSSGWKSSRSVKLCCHLVARLIMRGAVSPLHPPDASMIKLEYRENFVFVKG
jgi:hypothetical protein